MEINKVYGTLDGSWTKWYADGKKEEEGKYKGGKGRSIDDFCSGNVINCYW